MYSEYFNHYPHIAENRWETGTFIHKWWELYRRDSRWVPPYYPALRRTLLRDDPHLSRLYPQPIYFDAMRRQVDNSRDTDDSYKIGSLTNLHSMSLMEEPIAATVMLVERRRHPATAYLGLLQGINNEECVERLLDKVQELGWHQGVNRMVGPVGLSPYLQQGLLDNVFDQTPPLHTSYNPPFLPELLSHLLNPIAESQLYHASVNAAQKTTTVPELRITPLDPQRLADDLLPLFEEAVAIWPMFMPPDATEVAFILRQLAIAPLLGHVAEVDGEVVGFVLMQPDLSPVLRLAHGGRNLLWRAWLMWRLQQSCKAGRILYGAVKSGWRERGVGRVLWEQVHMTATQQGWERLSIGPVPVGSVASKVLTQWGAKNRQHYTLYSNQNE
ncbi:MAG: hypothetical protein AAF639_36180 [Chloroflexota bacterium]